MILQIGTKRRMSDEAGVISIITVVLLAMVLTLITTAFVRSTNSNQRQALDNQLSTQAFFAAETGINDITTLIKNGIITAEDAESDGNCKTYIDLINNNKSLISQGFANQSPNVLNSDNSIEYTCVMVSSEPDEISINRTEAGQGNIYPIKSADDNVIDKVNINWGGGQIATGANNEDLPSQAVWTNNSTVDAKALIRLSLYYPPSLSRDNLTSPSYQKTIFLKPYYHEEPNSNSLDINTIGDGSITKVACDNANECVLEIAGIDSLTDNTNRTFYVRVEPIYNPSSITIKAFSSSAVQKLKGAQFSIDVTGRSNDVYRRVEVRRKITTDWNFPDAVVQTSGDLCKQFTAWTKNPSDQNDLGYSDPAGCLSP
jgi:hypothetical protein